MIVPWSTNALEKLTGEPAEAFRDISERQRHLIATGQLKPPRRFHEIRVNGKPLSADLQRRLDRLRAYGTGKQKPTEPKLSYLDDKIRKQILDQPERHRDTLALLYKGWVGFNQCYFAGRLKLPIIKVTNRLDRDAQANCEIHSTPCVINFSYRYLLQNSGEYTLGILLHEMVHQAIAQHDGAQAAWDTPTGGHNQQFADICNRIAKDRGWRDVYVGCESNIKTAWHFPHNH